MDYNQARREFVQCWGTPTPNMILQRVGRELAEGSPFQSWVDPYASHTLVNWQHGNLLRSECLHTWACGLDAATLSDRLLERGFWPLPPGQAAACSGHALLTLFLADLPALLAAKPGRVAQGRQPLPVC